MCRRLLKTIADDNHDERHFYSLLAISTPAAMHNGLNLNNIVHVFLILTKLPSSKTANKSSSCSQSTVNRFST